MAYIQLFKIAASLQETGEMDPVRNFRDFPKGLSVIISDGEVEHFEG